MFQLRDLEEDEQAPVVIGIKRRIGYSDEDEDESRPKKRANTVDDIAVSLRRQRISNGRVGEIAVQDETESST